MSATYAVHVPSTLTQQMSMLEQPISSPTCDSRHASRIELRNPTSWLVLAVASFSIVAVFAAVFHPTGEEVIRSWSVTSAMLTVLLLGGGAVSCEQYAQWRSVWRR